MTMFYVYINHANEFIQMFILNDITFTLSCAVQSSSISNIITAATTSRYRSDYNKNIIYNT